MNKISDELIKITKQLANDVEAMTFAAPVSYVYNPLNYAWSAHAEYLMRYGNSKKEIILLGMNPGPFGMAQTGVPFGEVTLVRDWLGIHTVINQPPVLHPKRPIAGFACQRSEISGQRLWGWARTSFITPEQFFHQFFVINYCPLLFLEKSGRNRTPDKLPDAERQLLITACDAALIAMVEVLAAHYVIGVGNFAKERAKNVFTGQSILVTSVPHPSPANPIANHGWDKLMDRCLTELKI